MKESISYYLSHPIQYFSPLFKEMSQEFELQVYYLSDASIKGNTDKGFGRAIKWDIPLLEGYNHTFIKNYSWRKSLTNRIFDLINPGVFVSLVEDKSKIIIVNGWSYLSILWVIFFSKLIGKEVWLRAENPLNQELSKSKVILFIKKFLLKYFLFKIVDRFLYIGTENKKFFEFYGVSAAALVHTPYAVDNEFFAHQYKSRSSKKEDIKKELDISQKNVLLFVGKYIEKKRPMDLLLAFQRLHRTDVALVMVGEGQLRKQMEQYIAGEGIENVVLTGFVNQSEISKYYCVADIFVMCSGAGETWGLAVNEAMNFELPIVVSDTCGCASDLVANGKNGFIFREGDITGMTTAITPLIDSDDFRKDAGRESARRILSFSNQNIVSSIKQALNG